MILKLTGKKYIPTYNPLETKYKRVEFHGFIVNIDSKFYIITCAHNVKRYIPDKILNFRPIVLYKNHIFDIAILSCPYTDSAFCITNNISTQNNISIPQISNNTTVHNYGIVTGTNIYKTHKFLRLEYKILVSILPGISGSPILNKNNEILGMVSRASTKYAYGIPAYTIVHFLKTFSLNQTNKIEFHKSIIYEPHDLGVRITHYDSKNGPIYPGDIITYINKYRILHDGTVCLSIYPNTYVPFWFIMYHQLSGAIIRLGIIRNNNLIRYNKFIRYTLISPKINFMCIGPYILQTLKRNILFTHEQMSVLLQKFINHYQNCVLITAIIGAAKYNHEFQIVVAFNDVDIININHLNYLYLNNTSRIITLTLLDKTKIVLDYKDSIYDAHDIYSEITSNVM